MPVLNEPPEREPLDPREVLGQDVDEYVPPLRVRARDRTRRILEPLIWHQPSSVSNRLRFAWFELRERLAATGLRGLLPARKLVLRAVAVVALAAAVTTIGLLAFGGGSSGDASGDGERASSGSRTLTAAEANLPGLTKPSPAARDERRKPKRRERTRRPRRNRGAVAGATAESSGGGAATGQGTGGGGGGSGDSSPSPAPVSSPSPPPAAPAPTRPAPSPPSGGGGGGGGGRGGGNQGVPFDDSG